MACFRLTAKTCMLFLGLIFWAVAGGLFYIGGYIFYSHGHFEQIASSKYVLVPASLVLLIGLLVLVVGIIGCLAACTESRCLLATFFTLLTAILALLVAASVLAFVYEGEDELTRKMEKGWAEGFAKFDNDTAWKDEINYVQSTFGCCGITNATDWVDPSKNPSWSKHHQVDVPASCCDHPQGSTCPLAKGSEAEGKPGCASEIAKILKENLIWICLITAGLALILLIGMVSVGVVMCTHRDGGCGCSSPEENYETLNEDIAPRGGSGAGLRV